ncbi:MFS transporter [Haloplanus pelagicus]|jgi:MFS family permease|uniref:MFS transporter n=1 Tax=Haloplanus pelagicus TaxID=2949995 RepID=UPI00203B63CC|nr:MFS transporter [Haloplanus sp. HW8-1]
MRERWLYAWGLGSVAFGGASLLVPLYIVQLGGSAVQLGLLAATAAGIGAPGAILFGRLANRITHRRPLVLVTLLVGGVVLALVPTLTDITAVIVANAALWLVVGSIAPVLTMLVVDDAPEAVWDERIGLLNAYQGYGWAAGLVLGTVWPLVGRRVFDTATVTPALFWLLAGCADASTVWAARSLPRSAPTDHVTSARQARRIARLLSASNRGVKTATFAFSPNRLYWTTRGLHPRRLLDRDRRPPALTTYLVAATLFFTGFAVFWAPLPLFLTDVGFDSGTIFGVSLAASAASALLYRRVGTVASRVDVRLLQAGALAVRGALFPAILLVAGVGGLALELGIAVVGLAAIGVTWAVIAVVGTAIVTRLAPPAVRGEVLGVHTALGALAGGVGSVLGGWVATFGYAAAFGVAGGLVFLGAALVFSLRALSGGERTTARPDGAQSADPPPVALPTDASEAGRFG